MIERQKKFSIGEKTFTAQFPNVGQLIDLESLKQALTNNRYGVMAASGVASHVLCFGYGRCYRIPSSMRSERSEVL